MEKRKTDLVVTGYIFDDKNRVSVDEMGRGSLDMW